MSTEQGDVFDPEIEHYQVLKIPNKCTKTKARSSIPDVLVLKKVNDCVRVFAKRSLSRATQFGPLDAPLVTKNEVDESRFLIKLDINKCKRLDNVDAAYIYYDTTDENMCNWMMFVQPAKFFSEQNLCAHQAEDFIFYTTTREISPDEELKVWYSPSYAKFMSVSILTPTSGMLSMPPENTVTKKGRKAKTSIRMQVYLNSMVPERDVRSVPPKKRGWQRTKDKLPNGVNKSTSCLMYPNSSDPHCVIRKTFVRIPKTYECPTCHKTFKTGNKLRVHSVVHYAERNSLCDVCGLTYKRSDKLHEHIASKHRTGVAKIRKDTEPPNLDIFPFKCSDCAIGFRRRGMFINHIINKHPDLRTSDFAELNNPILKTVRDFLCSYCGKVYKSSTKRKLHILKDHPGQKLPPSIKSKRHGKVDNEAAAVIAKQHVAIKPVKCPYCEGQYTTKFKMNKHVKDKHPQHAMHGNNATSQIQPSVQAPITEWLTENSSMTASMACPGPLQNSSTTATPILNNQPAMVNASMPNQASFETPSEGERLVPPPTMVECCPQNGNDMPQMDHQSAALQQPYAISACDASMTNPNDMLTQAMSALESSSAPTTEPVATTSYNNQRYDPSFSRFAGGHKQVLLKQYENGQNVTAGQNTCTDQTTMRGGYSTNKQMPYKNRLLNSVNMWRQDPMPADAYQPYNQNPTSGHAVDTTAHQYHLGNSQGNQDGAMLDPSTGNFVYDGVQPPLEMQVTSEIPQPNLFQVICGDNQDDAAGIEPSELVAMYHNSSAGSWTYADSQSTVANGYMTR